MHPELKFQEDLAKQYGYKPLPKNLSDLAKQRYLDNLPIGLILSGDKKNLYTSEGTLIATGYNRIVIGDYGAFIEINHNQIIEDNLKVKIGQEFRYEEKFSLCKYYWLTAIDNSDVKVYHQKHTVKYADYRKGLYYISPYEVKINA